MVTVMDKEDARGNIEARYVRKQYGERGKGICEPDHAVFIPKSLWCSRATSAYIYS